MSTIDSDEDRPRGPACDICRNRKVKCDRQVPCSNCKQWKLKCNTTVRPRERKKRIVISEQYETEFRELNRKLETLSDTLQTIANNRSIDSSPGTKLQQQVGELLAGIKYEDDDGDRYEGSSSFQSHSQQVAQHFGDGFENPAGPGHPNGTTSSDARARVESVTSMPAHPSTNGALAELARLPLPSSAVVLTALRFSKAETARIYQAFPILSEQNVFDLCQKLYFSVESYPLATFISANACISYIMRELACMTSKTHGISREDCLQYAQMTRFNAITAIQYWNIAAGATCDNIRALVMVLYLLLEECQLSLAWNVITMAARLCRNAGYHREESYRLSLSEEATRNRRWLFWTVYAVDHAMSLNLGQAANIPDYDLTVEMPLRTGHTDPAWSKLWIWVEVARIQGRVYEQLYSARAQQVDSEARAKSASQLAAELHALQETFKPTHIDQFPDQYQRTIITLVRFLFSSTLTTIYKATPSPTMGGSPQPLQFSVECVEAARGTLNCLNEVWKDVRDELEEYWLMFINWSIVGCPFIAFIVIFGSSMMNNQADFELLGRSTKTIQSICEKSKGVINLVRTCQSFYQTACSHHNHSEMTIPQRDHQMPTTLPEDVGFSDPMVTGHDSLYINPSTFNNMDLSMQGDWDQMLHGWELGLGAQSARQMTSYLEQYPSMGGSGSPFS